MSEKFDPVISPATVGPQFPHLQWGYEYLLCHGEEGKMRWISVECLQHIRYSEGLLLSCYCMFSLRMHTICLFFITSVLKLRYKAQKEGFCVLAVELVSTFPGLEPSSVPICTLSSSVPFPIFHTSFIFIS